MANDAHRARSRPSGVWVCPDPNCGRFYRGAPPADGLCGKLVHSRRDAPELVWTPIPRLILEGFEEFCRLQHLANLCGPPKGTTLAFFRGVLHGDDAHGAEATHPQVDSVAGKPLRALRALRAAPDTRALKRELRHGNRYALALLRRRGLTYRDGAIRRKRPVS